MVAGGHCCAEYLNGGYLDSVYFSLPVTPTSVPNIVTEWVKDALQLTADKDVEITLLYDATKDGWNAADFHAACDNKGATVTLAKSSTGSDYFGGFADVSWASTNTFAHSTRSFLLRLESMLGTGLLLTIFVSTFQQCCRQPCGLQQWACAAAAHHGRNQADSNTTVWTASTPHQRARTCACRRMLAVRLILSPALCAVGKHRNVVCSEGATWATVQLEGIAWCSVHAQQRRSPPHAPRKNK